MASLGSPQVGWAVAQEEQRGRPWRPRGRTWLAHLAANENPLGASPRALRAARLGWRSASRYPGATAATHLKLQLAERLGCSHNEISLGNGSSELIDLTLRLFALPGRNVVSPRLSFVAYRMCAALIGCRFRETPLSAELSVDLAALLAAVDSQTSLVVLANPNNPTGSSLGAAELRCLAGALERRGVPLLLDYAYWEYAHAGPGQVAAPMPLYREFPNVMVLRTFSKAYGLAALRVGYVVARPETIEALERRRLPFSVSEPGLVAARVALEDEGHLARSVALATRGRAWLAARIPALGLRVDHGPTNFVLVDVGQPASPVCRRLLERGVVVQPMEAYGLPTSVRISVGLPSEDELAVRALGEVVGSRDTGAALA